MEEAARHRARELANTPESPPLRHLPREMELSSAANPDEKDYGTRDPESLDKRKKPLGVP